MILAVIECSKFSRYFNSGKKFGRYFLFKGEGRKKKVHRFGDPSPFKKNQHFCHYIVCLSDLRHVVQILANGCHVVSSLEQTDPVELPALVATRVLYLGTDGQVGPFPCFQEVASIVCFLFDFTNLQPATDEQLLHQLIEVEFLFIATPVAKTISLCGKG